MFFIVTTGRSGSTSIAQYISTSDNCICIHEPKPSLVSEAVEYLYGVFSQDQMVNLLKATRHHEQDGCVYGESNQKLSFIIPAIQSAFPDSKFIWLARDGRNVVSSIFALGWYDPDLLKGSKWQDNLVIAPNVGDLSEKQWDSMSSFDRCCWYWSFTNRLIKTKLLACNIQNWGFVKIEAIDYNLINSLLGLKGCKKKIPWVNKKRKAKNNQDWSSWDEGQKESFKRYCGPMMDELYPGWESPNGEWIVLNSLPIGTKIKHSFQNLLVNIKGKNSILYKAVNIPVQFVFRKHAPKILSKLDYIYKKISGEY